MTKKLSSREWESLLTRLENSSERSLKNDLWKKAFHVRATSDLDLSVEVLERADGGDALARSLVLQALDDHPAFVEREGNFATRTEEALLDATSSASWTLKEARRRSLRDVNREIAGASPSPLETAIARCVALSLAEVEYLETLAFRGELTEEFDRRRSRAHSRAMSAAKTLATLRRLAIPVVQVNVAREQINVAVGGATGDRDPT